MRVALIAAVARNGTIGDQGKLPWHIRDDLKRFKRLTMGHTILMGRKTYESIGKPLPGRRNVVLTRNPDFVAPPGVEVFRTLEDGLADSARQGEQRVFVIGGGEVYRQAFPLADEMFLTLIPRSVPGDTKFPPYDATAWVEVAREETPECSFVDYRRRPPTL